MKIKRYTLFLIPLLFLLSAMLGGAAIVCGYGASCGDSERITVLCAGMDDAAGNTDVLMLITLDRSQKEITVLQIPRDTYFSADTLQGKINQLYPAYRLAGADRAAAMERLSAAIAETFGVAIDYYAAVDLASVGYFVDRLGGVLVDVPTDIPTPGGVIPAGEHVLNGEEAIAFVRHRAGYAHGDLARVDAQKLLLVSVYRKLKNEISMAEALNLLPDIQKRIETDMPIARRISLACAYAADRDLYSVRLITLPGEATRADRDSGTWYYVANKKAGEAVLMQFFGSSGFDASGRMTDRRRAHFTAIYESDTLSYRVYTEETIEELEIISN